MNPFIKDSPGEENDLPFFKSQISYERFTSSTGHVVAINKAKQQHTHTHTCSPLPAPTNPGSPALSP